MGIQDTFLFDTTHHAIWSEEVAEDRGIPADVVAGFLAFDPLVAKDFFLHLFPLLEEKRVFQPRFFRAAQLGLCWSTTYHNAPL